MEARTADREMALGMFIVRYGCWAYGQAISMTRNREDADDLVQEAFYRLARYWERVSDVRDVRCLFLVILRNAFIDGLRTKRRALSMDVEHEGVLSYHETLPHPDPDVLDELIRKETASQVHECLDRLRPSYRHILKRADLEGKSYDRIAAELRLPIGTVKSRLNRARESFRKNANGLRPVTGIRSAMTK